jgi:hypothetical protein
MGETRNTEKILVGKPEGKRLEGVDVDGRILLDVILRKQGGRVWTGCIWFRIGVGGWLL